MRISTLSKALAAAALCAPLSAFALLAVPTGPVCLAGNAVHADKTIARDLANVADYQGPQALRRAVQLGPWEPDVLLEVVSVGPAVYADLDPRARASLQLAAQHALALQLQDG